LVTAFLETSFVTELFVPAGASLLLLLQLSPVARSGTAWVSGLGVKDESAGRAGRGV
jgi:hypothetical protein